MKKINISNILLLVFAVVVIGLIVWKQVKKSDEVSLVLTTKPFIDTIVEKKYINGNLLPDKEIYIKPQVSGVIQEVYIKVGEKIKKGQKIAKIRLMPEPEEVENAKRNLEVAEMGFQNEKKSFERNKTLYEKKVIAYADYQTAEYNFKLREQELISAKNKLKLTMEGHTDDIKEVSNVIESTVDGTVLDVPLKEGASVVKRNTYNDGTTIATIANLDNLIFKGNISEYDISFIKQGMSVEVKIGALNNKVLNGKITIISPNAVNNNGEMRFAIESEIKNYNEKVLIIPSGLSAVGEVAINKKKGVLCLKEKDIIYEGDSAFVNVIGFDNKAKKRFIKTGITDGLTTEITKGITINDRIKKGE